MITGELVAGLVHFPKSALSDLRDDLVDFGARRLEHASGCLWDV